MFSLLSFRLRHAWMSQSHMSTPMSWKRSQTFCSRALPLIDVGIPANTSVSPLEYSAFPQHWSWVTTIHFYQLTIHIPGNKHICLQLFRMSCQVFDFSSQFSNLWFQVCLEFQVFKISCARSVLLSFLITAPVWAPAISIYTLQ